ncbi:MAG TPA: acyl carrier protein [Myxococcota bacterium]
MHSKAEVLKWVVEILTHEFGLDAASLRPEARLEDDLDLDSIDAIDMAVRIEEKTRLVLSSDDLQSIQTIQDAVDLIHARL